MKKEEKIEQDTRIVNIVITAISASDNFTTVEKKNETRCITLSLIVRKESTLKEVIDRCSHNIYLVENVL